MAVHLIARKMGLADQSVKKLFVIGDLRSGSDSEWRFHVTTLIKGTEGNWFAVDPIMTPPLASGASILIEEWIGTIQNVWDKQHQARYYMVSNDSIIPDIRTVPDAQHEQGDRIIELKFDPTKQTGFQAQQFSGKQVFLLSAEAERKNFLGVSDPRPENRFQFLGMMINDMYFDFNNYFADLTQSVRNLAVEDQPEEERMMWLRAVETTDLGSPHLGALLRGL